MLNFEFKTQYLNVPWSPEPIPAGTTYFIDGQEVSLSTFLFRMEEEECLNS